MGITHHFIITQYFNPQIIMSTAETTNSNTTTTSTSTTKKKRWFPLESNPAALNHYMAKLGFNTSLYSFVDVYSTDEEYLSFLPAGCIGIIMLYPLTDKLDIKEDDKTTNTAEVSKDKVWFTKQRIGNACGTIGILHTLANLSQQLTEITITPSSWLHEFYTNTPNSMSPITKAEILESNDEIETLHDESTSNTRLNQTSRGNINDKVITHFVSIVNVEDKIYELDGRKKGPVLHGDTSEGRFLFDGMKVVKKFMDRDPSEIRFTILALVPTQD